MGAVADFVGDVVGGVVEAVGDVVEAVGDAVSDAVDWVGDNVVQPILDDPVTFIASAVAYSFGIPGLSFAGAGTAAAPAIATTGSRLIQGDDFDDAIKAGATAGVGTALGNIAGNAISSGGTNFSPNLYSSADDIAAAAANAGASVADDVIKSSADDVTRVASSTDDLVRQLDDIAEMPRDIYPDFEDLASTTDGPLIRKATTDPFASQSDAFGPRPPSPIDFDDAAIRATTRGAAETNPFEFQKSAFGFDDTIGAKGGYKPTTYSADDAITLKKEPIIVEPQPGDPGWKPPIEDRGPDWGREIIRQGPDVDKSLLDSVLDLGGAVTERAGSWLWDGAKWVWNNPLEAFAGLALIDTLGGKILGGGGPGDDDDDDKDVLDTDDKDGKTESDKDFYSNLEQLVLERERNRTGFDRSENPYLSDIYKYAQSGKGEHEFYTPSVYKPAEEYEAAETVNAARGGSIGALASQLPSYYRYGAMPMAMGGYAKGGLRSLQHDGRSDHIPAMLSDGEYVIDAETVALLGNGSNDAGANRLEKMRQDVRKQKGSALSKGKFSPNAKSPLAYMKQKRG